MPDGSIEEHKRKYFQALRPVADELRRAGFEINRDDFTHLQSKSGVILSLQAMGARQQADDLQYLSRKYGPLPKEAVDILIRWIPKIDYAPAQEVLISQLSRTRVKYDGNLLLDIFKATDSSLVRERIGFVLEESKPDIDLKELERILLDTKYGAKASLLLAGIKFLRKDRINSVLLLNLDQHFFIALRGLEKTGMEKELEFLASYVRRNELDKKKKKYAERAIEKIKKRTTAASQ
jgi:hypothetical protein